MYYICKFRTNWSIFDDTGQSDQTLESGDIDKIKKYFAALLEESKILTGLQISAIPPNKRLPVVEPQEFLISKIFSKWVIFDGSTQTDRWLDIAEIAWLKKLVPELLNQGGYTHHLLATTIQPTKLLQLSLGERPAHPNKALPKAT
ncbi:MAG: hypothetical protein BGO55_03265 [Sphingobacteriales bacterium 50-39]|nr:hypothetical protein [Sphingobacteriales bacterium]OJW55573.1 MAG: hypothetical protein BGO55_03265 [Sphingobacteriales bacterium 50-39]